MVSMCVTSFTFHGDERIPLINFFSCGLDQLEKQKSLDYLMFVLKYVVNAFEI